MEQLILKNIFYTLALLVSFSSFGQELLKEITKTFDNGKPMFIDFLDMEDLKKENISGGDSTILKIKFDPLNRKGRQFKNLTLFTNDPLNSTRVISLKAQIP